MRAGSSVRESDGLLIRRSRVQIAPGPYSETVSDANRQARFERREVARNAVSTSDRVLQIAPGPCSEPQSDSDAVTEPDGSGLK